MKVFKFGGASLKNAHAIRNMCEIIRHHREEQLVVVVSAMGKSTNALEKIFQCTVDHQDYTSHLKKFIEFHKEIVCELFTDLGAINLHIDKWRQYLEDVVNNKSFSPDQLYDAIVAAGELLSSTIISHYLNQSKINTVWTDARNLIQTDDTFREANVSWGRSKSRIRELMTKQDDRQVILTQGFIAATESGETTTLGREGSDFTGAIFASCLNADSFTVWKDVPGILNADPKRIDDATLFEELSYNEVSEMTYYGAKVIHPKTIKPLANQNIPLFVRCFDKPEANGTKIHHCQVVHKIPVVVFKENQCLVSFKFKDLTFVNEKGISIIFNTLHDLSINMNIMQNSAVSFSICVDYKEVKINQLIIALRDQFDIRYNTGLELVTIKNYTKQAIEKYLPDGKILLEQKSRSNYRMLMIRN